MNAGENDRESLHKELTGNIIKAAFNVHNTPGCGLLEKVSENALARQFTLSGRSVATQSGSSVCICVHPCSSVV